MKKLGALLLGVLIFDLPVLLGLTKQEFTCEVVRQTGGPRPDEKMHFLDVIDELWGDRGDLPLKGGQLRAIILGMADIDCCAGLTVTNFCQRYLEKVRMYGGINLPVARQQERAEEELCRICFERYGWNTRKFGLTCRHVFHDVCLMRWLAVQRVGLCPLCRGPLSIGEKMALRNGDSSAYAGLVREESKKRWQIEQAELAWLREEQRQWSEEAGAEEPAGIPIVEIDMRECEDHGSVGPWQVGADDANESNNDEIMREAQQ